MPKNYTVIILLTFLLGACTPNPVTPAPTATATLPAGIMFVAPELTATQTPVQKTDETATPNVTSTSVPTYTPVANLPQTRNLSYTLREATAEQADLMIAQVASHLKAIESDPIYASTYGYENYIMHYKYLASAEMEALLRFPDAPQAENWRWDICYNLALSYTYREDAHAPELDCYAKLIDNGLNSSQTNIDDLPGWLGAHESRFPFEIVSVTPPTGYNNRRIIRLEHSAFLLLLEKDGKFQTTGLMSNMFFFRESSAKSLVVDLTGDQFPELIMQFYNGSCCGFYSVYYVYDISSSTPKLLTFATTGGSYSFISSEENGEITALTGEAIPGLVFKSQNGDWNTEPCGLLSYKKYLWNGQQFELNNDWYTIEQSKSLEKDLCKFAVDTTSNQDEINVAVNTIQEMDSRDLSGYRQKILFGLGEYYAQVGNYEKAYQFFSNAAAPSDESNKKWIQAAKTLLKDYKKADDFYLACAKVEECDMQSALQGAIETIKPDLFPTVREALQGIGVPVKDSGVFDFDEDGSAEQWIVVQHPGKSQYEFWVLIKSSQKINSLFVSDIPSETPQINRFKVPYDYPTIELKTPKGKTLFSLQKMGISSQPYILLANPAKNSDDQNEQLDTAKAFWQESLDQAANAILTGTDPATVKATLLGLKKARNYDCKTFPCDQFFYYLGLAHELTGDQPAAVDAYLQLWQTYPESIYTLMARAKLEQIGDR